MFRISPPKIKDWNVKRLSAIETHPLQRGGTDLIFARRRPNENKTLVFDDPAIPVRLRFDLESDRDRKEVHGRRAKR